MKDEDLVERIHQNYQDFRQVKQLWLDRAEEAYRFVAGDQYTDEERLFLAQQYRPDTAFNKIAPYVQMICGLEITNRQQITYQARQPGPMPQSNADTLNSAADYFSDLCDAPNQHGNAFRDLVICGIGIGETEMDYERDPDGQIRVSRRDPLLCFWDHRSSEQNLRDIGYIGRVFMAQMDWIEAKWPDMADQLGDDNSFSEAFEHLNKRSDISLPGVDGYSNASNRGGQTIQRDEYMVCKYQYFVTKAFIRVAGPKGSMDFDPKEWNKLKKLHAPLESLNTRRITKREYRQAYVIGHTLMEDERLPVQSGFTLQAMTGLYDACDNNFYGLVYALKGPQEWVNKLMSQILHIINSNAKGGLYAERGAFENQAQAQEDYGKPDKILWLNPGAIAGGRIKERQQIPYPQATDRLMEISMAMFPQVTGINLELLGMQDRNQPGVLEAQRKQSSVTILSWAFDSLRAYKRESGRIFAEFIREFVADGRLIRITQSVGGQPVYQPLERDAMAAEYDVVVAESPQSVSEKDRMLMMLTQIAPMMAQLGMPPPPIEILEYLPLPSGLIEKWAQGRQSPESSIAAQEKAIEIQKKSADTALSVSRKQNLDMKTQREMMKTIKGE